MFHVLVLMFTQKSLHSFQHSIIQQCNKLTRKAQLINFVLKIYSNPKNIHEWIPTTMMKFFLCQSWERKNGNKLKVFWWLWRTSEKAPGIFQSVLCPQNMKFYRIFRNFSFEPKISFGPKISINNFFESRMVEKIWIKWLHVVQRRSFLPCNKFLMWKILIFSFFDQRKVCG
jgi:hypothetical protein